MFKKDSENRNFSRTLMAECKKYKMEVREKAFADLLSMGWKDKDAYMASGLYNHAYSIEVNDKEMNKLLMEDDLFMKYVKLTGIRLKKTSKKEQEEENNEDTLTEEDLSNAIKKENQLYELILAKRKYESGSKEWLEISKMIADITQAKKDEIKEEEKTIHYYLPITCYMCNLYIESKEKAKKQRVNKGE